MAVGPGVFLGGKVAGQTGSIALGAVVTLTALGATWLGSRMLGPGSASRTNSAGQNSATDTDEDHLLLQTDPEQGEKEESGE